MESQRVNEASFSVGAKSSPMLDVFQNQGVDQYILAALINQEDRFYILELGMAFEALIMNQRYFPYYLARELPSVNHFQKGIHVFVFLPFISESLPSARDFLCDLSQLNA
jgi:hypothetical protein